MGKLATQGSTLSFQAQRELEAHLEWIGDASITLLLHYWRPGDPVELSAALGADWAEMLKDLPQWAIERARLEWLTDFPDRKPGPGHIKRIASRKVAERAEREAPPPPPEPLRIAPSAESKARVDALFAEVTGKLRGAVADE